MGKPLHKSLLPGASQSRRPWRNHALALGLAALLGLSSSAAAFELRYGGRLADPSGAPLVGPVDITFRFYRDATGGTALLTIPSPGVALVDGMFNAPIPLRADEVDRLFEDGDRIVYIEVESQGMTFPRQMFSYVPLALRVPVDGSKIVYNGNGELTLGPDAPTGSTTLPGVTGSGGVESLGNQTYSTYALTAAGKALVAAPSATAQRNLLGLGPMATRNNVEFSDLPVAPCAEGNVLRLVGGAWSCVAIDLDGKLGGKTLVVGSPGTESNGKVIKWDGAKFVLAADALGAPDGGITSLNTLTANSQSLAIEVPGVEAGTMPSWSSDAASATHKLTMPMAADAGVGAGLLSKSQFDTFDAKQDAIASSSVLDAGTVSTTLQNGLELRPYSSETGNTGELRFRELSGGGSKYVGFKAPDAALSNTIWTLPPADGTGGYVLSTNGSGALSWISPTTGSVTRIETGAGLSGGPIQGVGTIALADIGTRGTYSKVTTNDQGQVISGASLAESDIPSLNASKITAGTLPVAVGGTGATSFTNHGVVVGSGSSPLSATAAGTPYQVLRAEAGGAPAFGAVSLDQAAAVTGVLPLANGGTGGATAEAARTSLGLGSAATHDAGPAANNLVQLSAEAKLPAVDGTQLTGVVKAAGDTMTGALNLPANGLAVGSDQLVVSGGNVGIGTTTPSQMLTVVGDYSDFPDAKQILIQGKTDPNQNLELGYHTTGDYGAVQAYKQFTGSRPLVLQPAGGNVGIGTTSPASKLHINSGDITISDADFHRGLMVKNTISSTPLYPYLSVQNYKSSTGGFPVIYLSNSRGSEAAPAALQAQDDLGMVIFSGQNDSTYPPQAAKIHAFADGDFVGNSIPTSLSVSTGSTAGMVERLRVTSAGNVGIGTSAPTAALDVNGTVRASAFTSTESAAYSFSGQGVSIGTSTPGTDIFFGSGAARAIGIQSQAATGNTLTVQAGGTTGTNVNGGDLILSSGTANGTGLSKIELKTASGGAPATAMTILGNGNVGIGATAPVSTLQVNSGRIVVGATDIGSTTAGVSVFGTSNGSPYGFQAGQSSTRNVTFGWMANSDAANGYSYIESYGGSNPLALQKAGGNVGIGTTAPTAKLQVSGLLKADSFSRSSDSYTLQLPNSGNNWFKLGTWTSTSLGARAEIVLHAGSYYNAAPGNEGITHIQMSMGNAASGVPNITGYFWAEGGVAAVSQMKAVMASTCTSGIACAAWDIYAFVRPNPGPDNFVEVKVGPSSTWTNSMTSATDPGTASNDLVEFRHQLNIPSGNVGIGRVIPSATLDVNGQVKATSVDVSGGIRSSLDTAEGGRLTLTNPSKTIGNASTWVLYNMGESYGNSLQFWAYDSLGCQVGGLCASRMTLKDNGNLGIGTTNPTSKLVVKGAARNEAAISNASSTIDFATGNLQYTSSDCGSFVLNNLKDGGSYTLAVQGTEVATCSFSAFSDNQTTALTVHLPPGHAAITSGKHTLYVFLVMGTHVYVSWTPGY